MKFSKLFLCLQVLFFICIPQAFSASRNIFPDHDGDFSAVLLVTDQDALKQYAKPPNELMVFKQIEKAKRGDIIAISLSFSGMELTNDQMSDVTFDLKVLDPEGKVYDKADLKDLEGLKIKILDRFNIFGSKAYTRIRFEQKDKLGKYQFFATIRDNIGKKSIHLRRVCELVE